MEAAERAAVPATLPPVVSERAGFSPAVLEAAVRTRMAETLPKLPGSRVGLAARSLDGGALPFAAALADGAAPGGGADSLADRLLRPPAPAAAEIAREIAQQIGARITPLARGQFELMLAPAELGRVEIALRELDGVLTLSVTAERPETMELIRRHLDLLAQDLRQIAQRELALQLGSGGAGSHAGTARSGAGPFAETADTATPTDPTSPSGPRPGLARDQLDLRL